MHAGIIFLMVIVGSILFHIFTPWYWTDIASNWKGMDDTITLTFWVGGGVFVAVCLFMIYCLFKFSYKEGRKVEYKPEDKKLERILTWATTLGVAALLAPGLIIWNQYVNVPKNAIEIDVMAWQWGWQYRLPGKDGKLGTTKVININDDNPFGINVDDPFGKDDVLIQGDIIIGMYHNLELRWMQYLELLHSIGLNQIKRASMRYYVLSTVELDIMQ
jgi:cytochrome c oxidase subunit 2